MSLSSLAGKSKLPGREIKIISWIWVCLQKPSTQKPARWLLGCPPAQMCQHTWSLANSSPQALLCTPHPLRKTRSRSLAPKLQNSRPDVGWVCSCYKFLHIKKKKSHVHVKMTKSAFPLVAPAPELMAWVLKGSAGPSPLWFWQGPFPPNPSKEASMSVPTDVGPVFRIGGRRGCTPGKRKDTFVVG